MNKYIYKQKEELDGSRYMLAELPLPGVRGGSKKGGGSGRRGQGREQGKGEGKGKRLGGIAETNWWMTVDG